ncbi:competence protein CoiA-like protein [Glaciihabitans tibetensis]|uniref:Competence protein CoiA-like protein n=2 Tax=Glaciihabitans tibetensis TaxID=1266600 RepID=A0A2T0VDT0_9MICO|nr:competence protein CoiA-like protein [Glaciihabitans tibetensis]
MVDASNLAESIPELGHAAPRRYKGRHVDDLALLQGGEGAFVWARRRDTGDLWYLDEDTGKANRPFVREHLVCPVPGCAERLTSAHRSTKRDGLQHFSGGGGHSLESIFHSQGCALIESWLKKAYPDYRVRREEYTNEAGERRADVLITNRDGLKVAFEVQYSSITPDDWRARHESYRAQEILDVWLFGHTKNHLDLDTHTGRLKPNPTHQAVVATKSPLFFLNPEYEIVGFAVSEDYEYDAFTDRLTRDPVHVLDRPRDAALQVRPLGSFHVSRLEGFSSDLLRILHNSTTELRRFNWNQHFRAAELRSHWQILAEQKRL